MIKSLFVSILVTFSIGHAFGAEKPLSVLDAVAEVCYYVDLCGQKTSASELNQLCPASDYQRDHTCYPKTFRSQHTCHSELEKYFADQAALMISDINIIHDQLTTPKESIALSEYTLACYSQINSMLLKQNPLHLQRYSKLISSITKSVEKFPAYKGLVNRGVKFPSDVLAKHHKVGNIVCYNNFTSTAVHDEELDRGDQTRNLFLQGKCTPRLYIKYEENGARPGRSIKAGSAIDSEDEVLFTPGACFRIDKVYKRTDHAESFDKDVKCKPNERYNFEMTVVPS